MSHLSITFLTTSGPLIGLGHLRRCLTLATELRALGASVDFALSGDKGGIEISAAAGFPAQHLGATVAEAVPGLGLAPRGLVVVDDYAADEQMLRTLRRSARSIAVIDDLADRPLTVADLVLNASPTATELPYRTSPGCARLFGPSYALLGPAFRGQPARAPRDRVERVLVTLGGADPQGQTPRVAASVRAALPDALIDVVIGPLFGVDAVDPALRCAVHRAPAGGLQPLMLSADLAVSAGGQTTYELAAMGLPAIALCLADNQRNNLAALTQLGTLVSVADAGPSLEVAVRALAEDVAQRRTMSSAGQRLVDGNGAVRTAKVLLGITENQERVHA